MDNPDFEVIVVDNDSQDDNFTKFALLYNHIKFIKNTGNLGFASGCNLGAAHAHSDLLLFLNPDCVASQNAVLDMAKFYSSQNLYQILTCSQNGKSKRLMFPNFVNLFGVLRAINKKINANKFKISVINNHKILNVDWVSGSVVMISKERFETISKWSLDYWMYFEDVDICKKNSDQNGKCGVLIATNIQHLHGGASRKNPKTTAITKSEVKISQHVYIQNHFGVFSKKISHLWLIFNNLFIGFLFFILSYPLFFIPKFQIQKYVFFKMLNYYINVLKNNTWISPRAVNFNLK